MSDKKTKVEAGDASALSSPEMNDIAAKDAVEGDAAPAPSSELESMTKPTDNIHVASKQATSTQVNNPLHGVKLQSIVEDLEAEYGWEGLAYRINIKCFKSDPSVKSSLKFLRRTPWARDKVERLFLKTFHKKYRPESY